jgi:antitoxin (DNA-binding transcriptional repressor) of toxin-antitoxin stability system
MPERIDIRSARPKLGALADLAASGEVIILTKRGKDIAQLSMIGQPRPEPTFEPPKKVTPQTPATQVSTKERQKRVDELLNQMRKVQKS